MSKEGERGAGEKSAFALEVTRPSCFEQKMFRFQACEKRT